MRLVFTPHGWDDYQRCVQSVRTTPKRLNRLIEETRTPGSESPSSCATPWRARGRGASLRSIGSFTLSLATTSSSSRPVTTTDRMVMQHDAVNASRLATTIVATMTSNINQAAVGGNVFVPAAWSGLSKDSVVNLHALFTLNNKDLDTPVGRLPTHLMDEIDQGPWRVLGLP